jgi:hypothetical protein
MSDLLNRKPYGPREDALLLADLNELVKFHLKGSPPYRSILGDYVEAKSIEDLPFLHVNLFKYMDFRTTDGKIKYKRTLLSSSTSGTSSKIALDEKSSTLQETSSKKILADFIGEGLRPLLVIDSLQSVVQRGTVSARIAASMSLKPFSSDMYFLLKRADDPQSMKWDLLVDLLGKNGSLLVYGLSSVLWLAWGSQALPGAVRSALKGRRITFVHSGGWKKLEESKVDQGLFNAKLLEDLHPGSAVVDYYGLVEQVGVVYPLCPEGYRHPPVWADVVVRDSFSLEPIVEKAGQIQLLNPLAWGAPYHSVYTEDIAIIEPGPCPCGRSGKRFKILGRMDQAEVRGCANV